MTDWVIAEASDPYPVLFLSFLTFNVPSGFSDPATMLVFWKYPLTDAKFREIRDETEARKAASCHLISGDGQQVETKR